MAQRDSMGRRDPGYYPDEDDRRYTQRRDERDFYRDPYESGREQFQAGSAASERGSWSDAPRGQQGGWGDETGNRGGQQARHYDSGSQQGGGYQGSGSQGSGPGYPGSGSHRGHGTERSQQGGSYGTGSGGTWGTEEDRSWRGRGAPWRGGEGTDSGYGGRGESPRGYGASPGSASGIESSGYGGYGGGLRSGWDERERASSGGGRDYGNMQGGSGGERQAHHDPDYQQWRNEQMRRLDEDYHSWRQERFKKFSDEFDQWRSSRKGQAALQRSSSAPTSYSAAGEEDPGSAGMSATDSRGTQASTGLAGTGGRGTSFGSSTSSIASAGDKSVDKSK